MSKTNASGRSKAPGGERIADWADGRLGIYKGAKKNLRKVFPDHWSFLLGEIALYSFIIIILTGVYLTMFFKPSMAEVHYHGSYVPMQGVIMSEAYASTLDISFDVRGGLLMRQIHHWAALIFLVAMFVHMMRVFFTGAFRKPRELNWLFGFLLLVLGMFTGFTGYSLPDDLLSGTGVRFMEGAILAVPLVGTYLAMFLYGGEFPGTDIIPRFFTFHVLLLPGIMLGLVVAHLILVFYHKHTQYPGAGRTNNNVVGFPLMPVYMAKAGGFFFLVFGLIAIISATFTINAVWVLGPYRPDLVSTNAQPDWYMGFSEGLIRVMPGWEWVIPTGHTLNFGVLVPLMIFPLVLASIAVYPFFEAWVTKDKREHHLLDRPRNAPTRTAFGAAWISWYFVMLVGGGNDLWAIHFDLSINAITWFVRIGFFVVPVLVFIVTRRICLGLQRRDREKVLHGRETGIIKRLPHGEFVEVHEPLSREQLHYLTQHDQPKPAELPAAVDENGVERKVGRLEKLRVKISQGYFGPSGQIEKPTAEEYKAIQSGHGHH
ncbi:cytochrome bc1 complex cytochrome b subunit [Streptomyces alkaliterrae]|uniref:Cytochrome bc1 complex cytochrome b subunit n=1 Tax=Streptomyces alkaliterrae TaxID=2213162 RepID=A0A5P0YNG9_9ACTN|nr:cytochrome b N-terminal domain-containing protein [Streptomyces alkaliterrae]MBB1253707.1 cytochrome b N-terminal domain-containing protein [Streptomyces alkaliterrae]MBB1260276.1 cytochrome b N-terminal domain-containing protein [Streptomyces alkaliterrae]MQS01856.1 ubiquinol-cytochrome c reductase cytochrome b subunit [Streptomyces alkaliterrae]